MLLSEYCTWKYFEINSYFLILSSILAWFHLSLAFVPLGAPYYMLSIKSCRDRKSNFQAKHDYFSTLASPMPSLFFQVSGFSALCPSSSSILWQSSMFYQCHYLRIVYLSFFHPKLHLHGSLKALGTDSPCWSRHKLQPIFFCFKWKCLTQRPISFTQDKCCTYDSGFSCSSGSD